MSRKTQDKVTWGHDDLAHDLANRFRSDTGLMVWENMQMGPSGSCRPDVYVIKKTYTTFQPISYEVKVTESDFRSDITAGKWQKYLEFSSAVVFAVPEGLISKNDIPNGCGLIVRYENMWRMAKKPVLNVIPTLPHSAWLKMLIDGVDHATRERIHNRPPASDWYMRDRINKKFGKKLGEIIYLALREQSELDQLKKQVAKEKEAYDKRLEDLRKDYHKEFDRIREMKLADLNRLTESQKQLAISLGLKDETNVSSLISAINTVRRRLKKDEEIDRYRRAIDTIKSACSRASEAFPGE